VGNNAARYYRLQMKRVMMNEQTPFAGTTGDLPEVHPGEILAKEFLLPLEISQYRLAKSIQVPPRRINEIIHGDRGITADTALRLALFFGNSARFWMNLQTEYDLRQTWRRHGKFLAREIVSACQVS
jgi:antitoxin HigA-1